MNPRSLLRGLGCLLAVAAATRAAAEPSIRDTALEDLSATHHSTVVTLDALDSSYLVPAPQRPLQNEKLVLRNLDPRLKLIAKLNAEGRPDLASADGMLRSILSDTMGEEEKAVAIWKFLVDWRYDYISPEAGPEVYDPVKLVNVYGYGLCGDTAAGFTALARAAGMPARVWGLGGHVVAEVWYAGAWHMFDANHEVFYRASDGHILSVEELAADPSAILSTPWDPVGAESGFMASLYTSTDSNFVYPPTPPSTHRIEPILDPLDEVSFDLGPGRVYSQSQESRALYPMYGPPPSYANGTLTRQLDASHAWSEWVIPVAWPFLLVGGDVSLSLAGDDADVEISIACDGLAFEVVPSTRTGQTLTASLRAFFEARRIGSYLCFLRIRSLTPALLSECIRSGQVQWLFQFAPRALQQVASGGTTFRADLVPVAGSVPADWQGFEIVHAWAETHDFLAPGAQRFAQAVSAESELVEGAASFDADSLVLTFRSAGRPLEGLQVFLDTDLNGTTGYPQAGLGAEFTVIGGRLLAYTRVPGETSWRWFVVGSALVTAPRPDVRQIEIPTAPLGLIAGGRLNVLARSTVSPNIWLDDLPRGNDRFELTVPHVVEQTGNAATDLVRADVSFDASDMIVRLRAEDGPLQNLHIYLDTDLNEATGYWHGSLGAEFLVENGFLYRYTGGAVQSWSFDFVAPVQRSSPDTNVLELRIPRAPLGLVSGTALTLRVEHWLHWVTRVDSLPRNQNWIIPVPNVVAQSGANAGDWVSGEATVQPGSIVFRLATLGGPPELVHVFVDADANPSTGYADRSLGSDYLIENDSVWRFAGQTPDDFSWTWAGPVELRSPTPNVLEIVLPTAGLEQSGTRAGVFVENWQDWITPLDSLPRAPGAWQIAW